MQLKDLFKPDQYGNIPIYRDTEGFLLVRSNVVDDTYEYVSKADVLDGNKSYFDADAEVTYVGRTESYIMHAANYKFPFTFYRVKCVPATAENILLAQILEKQV